MSTTVLHFTITGAYLTEQARDFWVLEGEPDRALSLLKTAFPKMSECLRVAIVTGKKKISGENEKCFVEADNATKHKGEKILSLRAMLKKQKDKIESDRKLKHWMKQIEIGEVSGCASPWGLIMVPRSLTKQKFGYSYCTMEWGEFEDLFPGQVNDARDRAEIMKQNIESDRLIKRMKKEGVDAVLGTPESFVNQSLLDSVPIHLRAAAAAAMAPPLKEAPDVDKTMSSPNGWLSPDGKYYPCGFMGHSRLADVLHPEGEAGLEKAWVKIQDSHDTQAVIARYKAPGSDFAHIPTRGVTQAQLNAMQRWCDKYGRQLPPELEVR